MRAQNRRPYAGMAPHYSLARHEENLQQNFATLILFCKEALDAPPILRLDTPGEHRTPTSVSITIGFVVSSPEESQQVFH